MKITILILIPLCLLVNGCGTPAPALKAAKELTFNVQQLSNDLNEFSKTNQQLTSERLANLKHLDEVTSGTRSFVDADRGMLKLRDSRKSQELEWVIKTADDPGLMPLDQPVLVKSGDKARLDRLKQLSDILSKLATEESLKDNLSFNIDFVKKTAADYNKKKKAANDDLKTANQQTSAKVATTLQETHK